MKNPDTRVQYSKARFHEAMLELLERRPIGTVTVKALCDQAELNRGTFYLHYTEPIDVLREMEWDLFERAMVFRKGDEADLESAFLRQIDTLEREKRLCAAVIGHNGDPLFLREVQDRMYEQLRDQIRTMFPSETGAQIKLQFQFLFSGVTGAVTSWLGGETTLSNEEMATMLAQFCAGVEKAIHTQGGER